MREKHLSMICLLIAILIFFVQCSNTGSNIESGAAPKTRLNINKLIPQDIGNQIASDITVNLYKNLKNLRGGERVLYREIDGLNKSANRQLSGTISKLGQSYVLTIKVVEGEKGKLLFNKTLMSKSIDDLNDKIEDIAEDISDTEDIW